MKTINTLTKDGLLIYHPKDGVTVRFNRNETSALLKQNIPWDTLDDHCELIHINVTNKCQMEPRCYGCYAQHGKKFMSVKDFKNIIDKCIKYGVHSVTLGGGEPLLHPKLKSIVKYAADRINIGVTTNGLNLRKLNVKTLKRFRQINISYHGNLSHVASCLLYLKRNNIKNGINYVYNTDTKDIVNALGGLCDTYKAELLMLQYKPVINDWDKYISPEETYAKAKEIKYLYNIDVAVDGGCALKCMQKIRFLTVGINGDVYPCSFIHEPSMGNILKSDIPSIWKSRGPQIICPYLKKDDQLKLNK